MTRIRLLPLTLVSACLIASGPAWPQEIQLFSAQHDLPLPSSASEPPNLKPWTVRALERRDLIALLDQGVLQVVLAGSPQDPRLETPAGRLEEELRGLGLLRREEALPRLTDARVPEGVMKLGVRQRSAGAACAGWTLLVEMNDVFGAEAPLRLPAMQNLTFTAAARIQVVPETAQARPLRPFSAPAELALSSQGGAIWEGPGRGTMNNPSPGRVRYDPEPPREPETGDGSQQGAADCRLHIGVAPS